MAKNMKLYLTISGHDDGAVKVLSATGKELRKVEKSVKYANNQVKMFVNTVNKLVGVASAYVSLGLGRQLLSDTDKLGLLPQTTAGAGEAFKYFNNPLQLKSMNGDKSNGQEDGSAGGGGVASYGTDSQDFVGAEEERQRQIKQHWQNQPELIQQAKAVFDDWVTETSYGSEMWSDATSNSVQKFKDTLIEAASTGKSSFADMARSIITDFMRIQVQQSMVQNLSKLFNTEFGAKVSPVFGPGTVPGSMKMGGKANGGYLGLEFGSARSDSQIIAVSGGEYVVNARQTARYLPLLEKINRGGYHGFVNGGYVAGNVPAQTQATPAPTPAVNVNFNDATGGAVSVGNVAQEVRPDGGVDLAARIEFIDTELARLVQDSGSSLARAISSAGGLELNKGGV